MALLAAVSAFAQAPPRPLNPAIREAVGYLLTPDKLDKYAQSSANVTALIAKDPAYKQKMEPQGKDAPQTVDQTVVWSKTHLPQYVAAIEKSGLPFREYIVFQACLIITMEAYKKPQYAASLHVRRENMVFVQTNRVKIEGILAQQRRQ